MHALELFGFLAGGTVVLTLAMIELEIFEWRRARGEPEKTDQG